VQRSKPTQVELELGELRRAIAQLASALAATVGWRPGPNGQVELAAIVEGERELIAAEIRPADPLPERREAVSA